MADQNGNEDLDVSEAVKELMEYQRGIDANAKNVVDMIKRMLDTHETLVPGCNARFAKKHGAWYDSVEKALVAAGFAAHGPYQNSAPSDQPDEKQSFYRFATSEDGSTLATWFLFPSDPPVHGVVLESWAEDGSSCATVSGVTPSGIPTLPTQSVKRFPDGASVPGLVKVHRSEVSKLRAPVKKAANVAEALRLRDEGMTAEEEYRRGLGLGLFEPMLRHSYGDKFDEFGAPVLESIQNNPHWWTGEEPADVAADPNAPLQFMFLMSRDDEDVGRTNITTMGLVFRGVSEMMMKELAANHCRAARFLVGAVAKRLVKDAANEPPPELAIQPEDPWILGEEPPKEPPPGQAITVGLRMERFGDGEDAAELLRVVPPKGFTGDADDWLRDACRTLGGTRMEIPKAVRLSAYEETMNAASEEARKLLPQLRSRLEGGLGAGESVVIKTGLDTASGGKEFVWVKVTEWPEGAFIGTLVVEPHDVPGYTLGQTMRVADADVFDRGIVSETTGMIEPPLTDSVAEDFGVDLPQQ